MLQPETAFKILLTCGFGFPYTAGEVGETATGAFDFVMNWFNSDSQGYFSAVMFDLCIRSVLSLYYGSRNSDFFMEIDKDSLGREVDDDYRVTSFSRIDETDFVRIVFAFGEYLLDKHRRTTYGFV